jgi:alkanesulfonate monooxygenase SsuD/methylene tetrahydromethanopterin reductase-like flavin-dependent oxidoreductase (luciferase family)
MYCSPRPGPNERIPILFGGQFTPRLIRRVVTLGDGWLLYGGLGMTIDQKAEAIRTLKQAVADAGRDPRTLVLGDGVSAIDGSVARSVEQIPALANAGVTLVSMHLRRFSNSPDEVLPALEEIVRRFEPYRTIEV